MIQILTIVFISAAAMGLMAAALHFSKYKKRNDGCGCGRGELLRENDTADVKVCNRDKKRSCVCE